MSILRGKTNISRFTVSMADNITDAGLRKILSKHTSIPLEPDTASECSSGFCCLDGNPNLELQNLFLSDKAAFGFRVDTKKVPPSAIKAALNEAVETFKESNPGTKVGSKIRKILKDQAKLDCLEQTLASVKVFNVIIVISESTVYTDATGPARDLLVGAMQECGLVPAGVNLLSDEEFKSIDGIVTIEEVLTKVAIQAAGEGIQTAFGKVALQGSVSFGEDNKGQTKSLSMTGDNIAFSTEFAVSVESKRKVKAVGLVLSNAETAIEFRMNSKDGLNIVVPKSEAVDLDDILEARMVTIKKICEVRDEILRAAYLAKDESKV